MSIKEPRNIVECRNKEEWNEAMGSTAVRYGEWKGPGYYAQFNYSQPCPRGCCYDDVTELVPLQEQIDKLKGYIQKLADSLRHYRDLNRKYDLLAKYTKE